jgi:hypothetical protein
VTYYDDDEAPEDKLQDDGDYVTPETRLAVLKRDEFRCRHCGDETFEALTLHHVRFRSQGGGHEAENLVTLCWRCHRMIHDRVLWVIRIAGSWFFRTKKTAARRAAHGPWRARWLARRAHRSTPDPDNDE